MIDTEIKKVGIKVTGKEVDAAVEDIRRRNNLTQEEMARHLEREGSTLDEFKKQLEKRMLRSKLIQWSVKVDAARREGVERVLSEKPRPVSNRGVLPACAYPVPRSKGGDPGPGPGDQKEMLECA